MARHYQVAMPTAGLVMSILAIIGALGALAAGNVINRIGDRETLAYGALLSIVANIGAYFSTSINMALLFRTLDGVTTIAFAVAGPMLLIRTTEGRRRTMALTLWATSISIGFQLGVLTASTTSGESWRNVFLGSIVLQVIGMALSRAFPPRANAEAREPLRQSLGILLSPRPMRLGLSFGALSLMRAGTNTILPHYFLATYGMPIVFTALLSSLSTLPDSAGSFAAGSLLARRWRAAAVGAVGVLILVTGGFFFMTPVFGRQAAIVGMFVFQIGNGWLAALLMTMLPQIRGQHSAGSASGIFNQLSFAGLVFAAPTALAVLGSFGWQGIVAFIAATGVAILLLIPIKGAFASVGGSHAHGGHE
jgi:predicted MFS family arabinose efflux permease